MRYQKATPGGTRTHNLWIRSPTRYPLRHWGLTRVTFCLFIFWYFTFKSTRSLSLKILHFWLVYLGPDFFTVSKRHHHRWSERIIWAGVILGTYSVVWVPWWPCRSVYWWVFDREVALKVDFIKNSILWVVFEQTDHLNFRENRFNTRSEIEFKILNR